MARPTVRDQAMFYTVGDVRRMFDVTTRWLLLRINDKVLTKPTRIDGNGTRLFNHAWIQKNAPRIREMKASRKLPVDGNV